MPGKTIVLYDYAMRHVGLPYRWGGDDPVNGYDCSGFAIECMTAVGAWSSGDTTAQGIYNHLRSHGKSNVEPEVGALCFYGKSVTHITHVGVCIGKQLMIEAGGGGSKTLTLVDAVEQNAFLRVRPINRRADLVAVLMAVDD